MIEIPYRKGIKLGDAVVHPIEGTPHYRIVVLSNHYSSKKYAERAGCEFYMTLPNQSVLAN